MKSQIRLFYFALANYTHRST